MQRGHREHREHRDMHSEHRGSQREHRERSRDPWDGDQDSRSAHQDTQMGHRERRGRGRGRPWGTRKGQGGHEGGTRLCQECHTHAHMVTQTHDEQAGMDADAHVRVQTGRGSQPPAGPQWASTDARNTALATPSQCTRLGPIAQLATGRGRSGTTDDLTKINKIHRSRATPSGGRGHAPTPSHGRTRSSQCAGVEAAGAGRAGAGRANQPCQHLNGTRGGSGARRRTLRPCPVPQSQ